MFDVVVVFIVNYRIEVICSCEREFQFVLSDYVEIGFRWEYYNDDQCCIRFCMYYYCFSVVGFVDDICNERLYKCFDVVL